MLSIRAYANSNKNTQNRTYPKVSTIPSRDRAVEDPLRFLPTSSAFDSGRPKRWAWRALSPTIAVNFCLTPQDPT